MLPACLSSLSARAGSSNSDTFAATPLLSQGRPPSVCGVRRAQRPGAEGGKAHPERAQQAGPVPTGEKGNCQDSGRQGEKNAACVRKPPTGCLRGGGSDGQLYVPPFWRRPATSLRFKLGLASNRLPVATSRRTRRQDTRLISFPFRVPSPPACCTLALEPNPGPGPAAGGPRRPPPRRLDPQGRADEHAGRVGETARLLRGVARGGWTWWRDGVRGIAAAHAIGSR